MGKHAIGDETALQIPRDAQILAEVKKIQVRIGTAQERTDDCETVIQLCHEYRNLQVGTMCTLFLAENKARDLQLGRQASAESTPSIITGMLCTPSRSAAG
jgi:hypothetical protein